MAKKQTKAHLQAIIDEQQLEIERLRSELLGERRLREIDLFHLNNASIHNRYLNDEVAGMEKSHAKSVRVHRDVIELLLNQHEYEPRKVGWVDESGKPIVVKLNSTVETSIHNKVTQSNEETRRG